MSSNPDFVTYACGQMAGAGDIRFRKMMGDYVVYCGEKLPVLICDDEIYLKITAAGKALLPGAEAAPPYDGAKPCFVVTQFVDDADVLARLVRATADALPAPKPKKK